MDDNKMNVTTEKSPKEQKPYKKRKSNIMAALACALVVAGGGTLIAAGIQAYLTDTDTATNTFTIGEVQIETIEPNYPGNGSDEVQDLVPLEEIPKDPQIKNSGKNRAIVFSQVDIPMVNLITAQDDGTRNETANTELFAFRTNDGDYNSVHPEWILINVAYLDAEGNDTSQDKAVTCRRLYGYQTQLEEDEITTSIFDVVRLANVIEEQIDNSTQEIVLTSYGVQADNIKGLTSAHYDEVMDAEQLTNIYNVYVSQSGDVIPDDADTANDSTLINTTLNVTMTVENTHLKLRTGDEADAKTAANVKIAYTGKGTAPDYTFESSNPDVATVDAAGNIQGLSVGNTIITVSATNPDTGKVATASVTITVRDMNAGED